ncbi:MAG: acyltransferase family protein [Actinomycetota bacterium]
MNEERPLRHEPGLDGVRSIGLAMALLTHSGYAWAPGGFVGVSVFFAMSGFLITTLLLRPAPDRAAMADFWIRRFRRLLPPALLMIAGTLILGFLVDLGPTRADLQSDALASLLYFANWHFLITGNTYDAIFTAPSPFHHMWSLSIEEQFYLFFPFVIFGLRRAGLTLRQIGWVMVGLWALAVAANLWTGVVYGADTTYLATHSRLSEIMAGAALACLVPGLLDRDRRVDISNRVRSWVLAAALIGSIVNVGFFFTIRDSDPEIAQGVLPIVSVASVAIVAGILLVPRFSAAMSVGPLPLIGRMSYAVYLIHWPIFLWLTPERTGLGDLPLLLLRLIVTFALAGLSYRFIETPSRRYATRPPLPVIVAPVMAAVAAAVLIIVPTTDDLSVVEAAEAELETLFSDRVASTSTTAAPVEATAATGAETDAAPSLSTSSPTTVPNGPIVAAMFGDSTAFFTQFGVGRWALENTEELVLVEGGATVGCPLGRGGERDFDRGITAPGPECDWTDAWPSIIERQGIEIAILQVGPWEVAEYRATPSAQWTRIGEPEHEAYLEAELRASVNALLAGGAEQVIVLTSPYIHVGRLDPSRTAGAIAASEPERMDAFNALLQRLFSTEERVAVVDLAGHVASISNGLVDPDLMPDGLHFDEAASNLVGEWLSPTIVETANAR